MRVNMKTKSKIYSDEEIELLLKNPFVIGVAYNRFIMYDPIFKLWCVLKRFRYPYETCRHLFETAGFPIDIMSPKLPQARIKAWENLFFRYGTEYFTEKEMVALIRKELLKYRMPVRRKQSQLIKEIYSEVDDMLDYFNEDIEENRI